MLSRGRLGWLGLLLLLCASGCRSSDSLGWWPNALVCGLTEAPPNPKPNSPQVVWLIPPQVCASCYDEALQLHQWLRAVNQESVWVFVYSDARGRAALPQRAAKANLSDWCAMAYADAPFVGTPYYPHAWLLNADGSVYAQQQLGSADHGALRTKLAQWLGLLQNPAFRH